MRPILCEKLRESRKKLMDTLTLYSDARCRDTIDEELLYNGDNAFHRFNYVGIEVGIDAILKPQGRFGGIFSP